MGERVAIAAVTFEVAAAVAGVGRFAASVVVAAVDGKAISAFPDKSIQKLFASLRAARSARPSSLVRYGLSEFSGWQVGAAGTYSSRDKE